MKKNLRSAAQNAQNVSGAIIAATVAFGLSRGIRMDQICEVAGLSPLEIVDPHTRLPENSLLAIWKLFLSVEDDGAFPIAMAKAAPLTIFGGLGEGAQFAGTLQDAINLLVRNPIVLADRLSFELTTVQGQTRLCHHHPVDQVDRGLISALGVALLCRLFTKTLGITDAVSDVELVLPDSGNRAAYREYFGVPIRFGSDANAIGFQAKALETKIDHASAELFAYVEEHFAQIRERLKRIAWPSSLHTLRQSIIDNAERNDYSAISAAAGANMGLRTAQRLAVSEGYSLQRLIDDVRLESAKCLLDDLSLGMDAIAFTLGYSDDRAFRRAFKRMTGVSPSEYRAKLRYSGS